MRVCPQCGKVYPDDDLRFCLMDGAQLVAGESQPTVVIPRADSTAQTVVRPRKKRNPLVWVVVALAILMLGGGALAGLLIYAYRLGSESARSDRQPTIVSTPTRSTNPTRSPTPSAGVPPGSPEPSATTAATSTTGAETEEVTPISWTDAASSFKTDPGRTYRFLCPPGGPLGIVWGNDIYTADSSICTAAVHAGKIKMDDGGEVTIEFRPGRSIYGSTTRNGVTSHTFPDYPHSFVFK